MAAVNGKRALQSDEQTNDAKRIRSSDGSPVPATKSANAALDKEARMAAIRAKLAAKKLESGQPTGVIEAPVSTTEPPHRDGINGAAKANQDIAAKKEEAAKRIAELKAKMAARKSQAPPTAIATNVSSDKEVRIADARARAAEIAKRVASAHASTEQQQQQSIRLDEDRSTRAGLGIGLHPALMNNTNLGLPHSKTGRTARDAKAGESSVANPYLSAPGDKAKAPDDEGYDPSLVVRKGGDRKSKQLVFNQKGKFMAQADALRHQAHMEEMKRRMAEEARKAEIEEASDKAFLVDAPPDVSWWDENIVDKIDTADSIITALIQHPVILQAPQDRFQPAPKPLMLTPKEQKKLRRQRRMADMKEEQAKIRLGLIPPPPPKVKKSNMMTVLGEQAVKDPTAVEARVNREIAQRAADHEQANADRQLTHEQRLEKLKRQQEGDDARGIHIAVFRVEDLSSGKHRYQIDINAKQNSLTGIVVLHPEMNVVIVEGGTHAIRAYKKLMLNRIKWSDNTMPLSNSTGPSTFTGGNDGTKAQGGEQSKASRWLNPLDDNGQLKDLSENRCLLVWEGEEPQRSFKKWGSKACETDGEARDVLSRNKMENMWTLARSTKPDVF